MRDKWHHFFARGPLLRLGKNFYGLKTDVIGETVKEKWVNN